MIGKEDLKLVVDQGLTGIGNAMLSCIGLVLRVFGLLSSLRDRR